MTKEFYLEELKKIMTAINIAAEGRNLTIKDVIDLLRLQFDVLREVYNQDKEGDAK